MVEIDPFGQKRKEGTAMMQGDAYSLPIVLRQGGLLITPEMVLRLEITIGNLTRTYPGAVRYDADGGQWLFPLTQEQTFAFQAGRTPPVQARIKFNDESVVGAKGKTIYVAASRSKGVL